ncbi:MAG TPA: ThuA domain-containing protein, partial [Polyangiaceae bacterium]|nr:ThuA domain-containing protein [Polyangiaceae bacterium]
MNRATRGWSLLGAASFLLACGNEAAPVAGSAGAPSAGASGASAGTSVGGSGGSSVAGGSGTSSATSGSGGQSTSIGGTASPSAGASGSAGGAAGASLGGGGGSAGVAAVGGAAGAGGDPNLPALPKRMLLYHFSTAVIETVPAQLTFLKNQLMTWGYEVEDSVNPDDISTANLARFGGVGMINTCFEPFGMGKPGTAQAAALKAFVENGGGLFGNHCAAVTFQAAEPPHAYNDVIGGRGGHGYFDGKSACRTTEQHVTTAMLPATFDFSGNLDNADYVAADTKVLVKCKWSGGDMKDTAVSWYRTPGKGRVFYTNFAKIDADLNDATLG